MEKPCNGVIEQELKNLECFSLSNSRKFVFVIVVSSFLMLAVSIWPWGRPAIKVCLFIINLYFFDVADLEAHRLLDEIDHIIGILPFIVEKHLRNKQGEDPSGLQQVLMENNELRR